MNCSTLLLGGEGRGVFQQRAYAEGYNRQHAEEGAEMSIYEEFGVRAIISVSGSSTRVGGALMPAEVVEAMSEAALESVSMVELQAAASRRIRMATGAEAGLSAPTLPGPPTQGRAFRLSTVEEIPLALSVSKGGVNQPRSWLLKLGKPSSFARLALRQRKSQCP